MIISTMNDLPGYHVDEVLGEVWTEICAYGTAVRVTQG